MLGEYCVGTPLITDSITSEYDTAFVAPVSFCEFGILDMPMLKPEFAKATKPKDKSRPRRMRASTQPPAAKLIRCEQIS